MRRIAFALAVLVGLPAAARAEDQFHTLRFFLHPDLVAGIDTPQLQARLTQYAADLNLIFAKQTNRHFVFDPVTGITITDTKPHTDSAGTLPETGYELWVHAVLTDNPLYGTYGGYAGIDTSGAGVAAGLKSDAVYDPSTLTGTSSGVMQYWRQIDHVTHEFEHVFGAGGGEYYNLAIVNDTTGVAPVVNIYKSATDPYWGQRQDYFTDPLLNNIYDLDLAGSPTTLEDLRDTIRFADVTAAVVNRGPRQTTSKIATLPDLLAVKVEVLDDATGLPIPGATVRVWNVRSFSPYETEELPVLPDGAPGFFEFPWPPYPNIAVFGNYDHLKLIKAMADGYDPGATWVSLYDTQQVKMVDGSDVMVVSLRLTPEPATLVLLALGGLGLWTRRRGRK